MLPSFFLPGFCGGLLSFVSLVFTMYSPVSTFWGVFLAVNVEVFTWFLILSRFYWILLSFFCNISPSFDVLFLVSSDFTLELWFGQ